MPRSVRRGARVLAPPLVLVLLFAACGGENPIGPTRSELPAVVDLSVVATTDSSVTLAWTAPGGSAATQARRYDIRMSLRPITDVRWDLATVVDSTRRPAAAGTRERITVEGLASWTPYHFALKSTDGAGHWSALSNVTRAITQLPLMQPHHLDTGGDAGDPSWSPDGSTIAFVSARSGTPSIWTIAATGGTPAPLTGDQAWDGGPSWSPDGSTIAFHRAEGIWVMPADGDTATRITPAWLQASNPSWSPDGSIIAFDVFAQDQIWMVPAAGGSPWPLVTTTAGQDFAPAWSPDGSTIAFTSLDSTGRKNLWSVPSTGGASLQLTSDPFGASQNPAWSPDGSLIAYEQGLDIWLLSTTSGATGPVTSDPAPDGAPAWSPDGTMIVYESRRGGRADLWIVRIR